MAEQLSLLGPDAPQSPIPPTPVATDFLRKPRGSFKNLFFALLPDPAVAEAIYGQSVLLDRVRGLGGELLEANRLHVSLHGVGGFFDDVPADIVRQATQAADAVRCTPFDVVFERAMSFPSSKAYVLRVGGGMEPLQAFRLGLGIAMANVGLPAKPGFTPHMTLSYRGRTVPEHAIEPLHWRVQEFALISSHVGQSYYEVLGRWPLKG